MRGMIPAVRETSDRIRAGSSTNSLAGRGGLRSRVPPPGIARNGPRTQRITGKRRTLMANVPGCVTDRPANIGNLLWTRRSCGAMLVTRPSFCCSSGQRQTHPPG